MSKTVTSNEGSKKKKDLLSKYPNKDIGPNCIIFNPGERQIESNKEAAIDISWLEDLENVMTIPVIDTIRENYEEIPAERGTVPKSERTSRKNAEKTEKSERKTSTKKSTEREELR